VKIFEGTGVFTGVRSSKVRQAASALGDVTLDFVDVDIHDVIRSVLGQMLKVPYAIDPQVAGHVTLRTGTPIAQDAVLPALETALKSAGTAVVLTNGIYNVVPLADAQKRVGHVAFGSEENGPTGYGIEIVPLHYISAEAMQKLLAPLVPQSGILSIDPDRNLIFLAGTEPERASIKDTIALFDVDYLQGMSYALVQPSHVDVGTLASELSKIFDDTSSPIAGLIRMIPIARINTLMIVSSRGSYLREVSRWIERLDVVPVTPNRQLHYYRLLSARAADVAQTLGQFFGGASASLGPTPLPQPILPYTRTDSGPASAIRPPGDGLTPPEPVPPPVSAPEPTFHPVENGEGPQIVTDVANNALIIRADAADYAQIEDVIRHMDVIPDQVLVEVTIAEVTLTDQLKYGVEWFFQNGGATFAQGQTGKPATRFPGFGFTYNVPNVQVTLSALGTLTKVNVVSSPKLLMLDNKSGTLQVGDQVPIVTQTAVSSVSPNAPLISTVEQRDTGVILTVTPRIGVNGVVFLDVAQEVSNVIPTTTSGIDSPTIQQRRLKSTVAVGDGSTIALGGLMRRSDTSSNGGVPYLKDIPVLGALFSNANDERDRTELLIFLTPRVLRSPQAAIAITDDLTKGLEDVQRAVRRFENRRNDIPRTPWR
jgi:general secretion pathway protein D